MLIVASVAHTLSNLPQSEHCEDIIVQRTISSRSDIIAKGDITYIVYDNA